MIDQLKKTTFLTWGKTHGLFGNYKNHSSVISQIGVCGGSILIEMEGVFLVDLQLKFVNDSLFDNDLFDALG